MELRERLSIVIDYCKYDYPEWLGIIKRVFKVEDIVNAPTLPISDEDYVRVL